MVYVPDHVENAGAYIRATEARIAANRCKGNRKRWEAESGLDVVNRCLEFLGEYGEFARIEVMDEDGYITSSKPHPLVKASYGEFFSKMNHAVHDWGRLSPGQERAVLAMIARAEERVAGRDKQRAEEAAKAQWIGTVGERREFVLKIVHVHEMIGQYGISYITVMKDDAGNTVVQKGTYVGYKGCTVTIKATIKEHGERDGVKQTIITRPKVLATIEPPEGE